MDLIKTIEEQQKRAGAQPFNIGDTVAVHFKIIEGKTERVQKFEGLVIAMKNEGARRTFTVRKNSFGVSFETAAAAAAALRAAIASVAAAPRSSLTFAALPTLSRI